MEIVEYDGEFSSSFQIPWITSTSNTVTQIKLHVKELG